jgi:hypothetical protein
MNGQAKALESGAEAGGRGAGFLVMSGDGTDIPGAPGVVVGSSVSKIFQ